MLHDSSRQVRVEVARAPEKSATQQRSKRASYRLRRISVRRITQISTWNIRPASALVRESAEECEIAIIVTGCCQLYARIKILCNLASPSAGSSYPRRAPRARAIGNFFKNTSYVQLRSIGSGTIEYFVSIRHVRVADVPQEGRSCPSNVDGLADGSLDERSPFRCFKP